MCENNIDKLYLVGNYAKYIADEARNNGYDSNSIFVYDDKEMLLKTLIKQIQEGDIILFKASNGMKLYEIVEKLESQLTAF